jgi:nuclear cap-binding protein subunit 2
MGLHREKKTPCGFAFVEYFDRSSCLDAEALLNGKTLDGRVLKIELDPGFKEGRQFGRGRGGGQVRDDFRETDDPERGGVGSLASAGLLPSTSTTAAFMPHPQPFLVQPSGPAPTLSLDAPLPFSRPSYTGGDSGGHGDRGGGGGYEKRGRYSREGGNRGFDNKRGGGRARSRDRGRYSNSGGRNRPPATQQPKAPQVDEFGRDVAPQGPDDTDYE